MEVLSKSTTIVLLLPLCFSVIFSFLRRKNAPAAKGLTEIPVYGPWYIPSFLRGIYAMYRLGSSEDEFLVSLYRNYGPLVYIPAPADQYYALSASLIQAVYSTPNSKLSFIPIRKEYQSSIFGSPRQLSYSETLPTLFPIHAKGLEPGKLGSIMERFLTTATEQVQELARIVDDAKDGTVEIDLVEWVTDAMFQSASSALFGHAFRIRTRGNDTSTEPLRPVFNIFDGAFGLLASGKIPTFLQGFITPVKRSIEARESILNTLEEWILDGMPGLDHGDVVFTMASMALADGFNPREVATILFAELWALQANAPYTTLSLLLYLVQAPKEVQQKVWDEINSLPLTEECLPDASPSNTDKMYLISSCIQETLRAATSSFSIRIAQDNFALSCSSDVPWEPETSSYYIPKGSTVICITRVPHLTNPIWGGEPELWDGERFMPGNRPIPGLSDDELRARRLKMMRGFGGGVSICEGRHFAQAELKAFISLVLSMFNIELLQVTSLDGKTVLPKDRARHWAIFKKQGESLMTKGMGPLRIDGRPGLAAFQFGKSDVKARITRKTWSSK